MTETRKDLAIETLHAVCAEVAPSVSEKLILACYNLQTSHQFDRDRTFTLQAMEKLIDEYVAGLGPNDTARSK